MSQVNIEDFINKHLVKVLWAIVIYFLMDLSSSFKEVKVTLQQMLINQAVVDLRLSNVESQLKSNTLDIQTIKDNKQDKK